MTDSSKKKRLVADIFRYSASGIATSLSVIILLGILIYIFAVGAPRLSWNLLTSDYEEHLISIKVGSTDEEFIDPEIEGAYFASEYGIAIIDSETTDGHHSIEIAYVDQNSPFRNATNRQTKEKIEMKVGDRIDILMGINAQGEIISVSGNDQAKDYANVLNQMTSITSIQCKVGGGGIRGSLLTTLLLIVMTLVFALPLGVGGSIYLVQYAKDGKLKSTIQTMIDMISGIPSIIFGFCGAIIFIPFVSIISPTEGYTVMAGALTMTIVLLPTIIKTTSEALMVIPDHYTMASLALGASKTQTVFKVILPNALPGILTATLLSIGRIIGESAALIFVMGTAISDKVNLFGPSTSLAVHIWSITSGEKPNYETACSISIIILIVVFLLSITVKLISKKLNKMAVNS